MYVHMGAARFHACLTTDQSLSLLWKLLIVKIRTVPPKRNVALIHTCNFA